jgi:hypothetical protein
MKTKTNRELEAELIALGSTSEMIAQALTAMGVKGKPHQTCGCPLSVYLTSVARKRVAVGSGYGWIDRKPLREKDFFTLPEACSDFIVKFDAGDYPDIMEK